MFGYGPERLSDRINWTSCFFFYSHINVCDVFNLRTPNSHFSFSSLQTAKVLVGRLFV